MHGGGAAAVAVAIAPGHHAAQPRSLGSKCVIWCKIMILVALFADSVVTWFILAYFFMYQPPVHVLFEHSTNTSSLVSSLFNVTLSSSCPSWIYSHDTSSFNPVVNHTISGSSSSNNDSISGIMMNTNNIVDDLVSWSPSILILVMIYAGVSHLTWVSYALSEATVVINPLPAMCRRPPRGDDLFCWMLIMFIVCAAPLIPLVVVAKMIAVCSCLPFYPDMIQAYGAGQQHPNEKILNVIKGVSCTIGVPLSLLIIYSILSCGEPLVHGTPLGTCIILQASLVIVRVFFLRVYWPVIMYVKDRIVHCVSWWCGSAADPHARPLLPAGVAGHGHGGAPPAAAADPI